MHHALSTIWGPTIHRSTTFTVLDDTIETVKDNMRENDSASRHINETVHEDIRENASASCPINDLGASDTSIQRALKLLHDPPSHRRKEMMGKLANTLEENRKSRQEHLSTCTESDKIDKTIVALGLNIDQLRQLYKAQTHSGTEGGAS